MFLRPPTWNSFLSPSAPETKLYFLVLESNTWTKKHKIEKNSNAQKVANISNISSLKEKKNSSLYPRVRSENKNELYTKVSEFIISVNWISYYNWYWYVLQDNSLGEIPWKYHTQFKDTTHHTKSITKKYNKQVDLSYKRNWETQTDLCIHVEFAYCHDYNYIMRFDCFIKNHVSLFWKKN